MARISSRQLITGLALGGVASLFWLERRYPLRLNSLAAPRRKAQNLALGLIGAMVLSRLSHHPKAQNHKTGWIQNLIKLLLLDYTLYLWHWLNHRLPLLWRFHHVHHSDQALDTTTAARFHIIELSLSALWRFGQIRLLGVSPGLLSLWQALLQLSIYFHHANLALPPGLDQQLQRWIVTPQLHTVHHADQPQYAHRNFSSGLTLWDKLHGTFRTEPDTEQLSIGAPDGRPPESDLKGLLLGPFKPQA